MGLLFLLYTYVFKSELRPRVSTFLSILLSVSTPCGTILSLYQGKVFDPVSLFINLNFYIGVTGGHMTSEPLFTCSKVILMRVERDITIFLLLNGLVKTQTGDSNGIQGVKVVYRRVKNNSSSGYT